MIMTHRFLLLITTLLLVMAACNTVKKSYQSGDFETAIEKSLKKIKSNPNDEDNIIYLEAAYDKFYYQKMDRIAFLKKEGQPQNVVIIYNEMQWLRDIENEIKPLLPLHIASKNRNATFPFISDEDLIASKNKAAEYLYAHAVKLLSNSNKEDARTAYYDLQQLNSIYPNYKEANAKMKDALNAGTNRVLVQIVNNSSANLFTELEKELTTLPLGDLQAPWVYFTNQNSGSFDYKVTMNVLHIDVTPDLQNIARSYVDSKTIQDGWNYQYDSHGNVMKDSLGNDIKTPRYITIQCMVTEWLQQKTSTVGGKLEFVRTADNGLLYSYPFNTTKVFQHVWATANGDLNALTPESLAKVKAGPIPFPNEIDLLLQAGEDLKWEMKEVIEDHAEVVMD
jgi:tetratricopeptide (TPR) repeat protein